MATKRILSALSASLIMAVIVVLVVVALNRPVDEIGLLLMVLLVLGVGVFAGARTKQRQQN